MFEVITGNPDAIASNNTSPQPSLIEGKTKASAQRYKTGMFRSGITPGRIRDLPILSLCCRARSKNLRR